MKHENELKHPTGQFNLNQFVLQSTQTNGLIMT
jgi:hypothetical protein